MRLWDVASAKPRATLAGHRAMINSLAFTADGQNLASAGADRTVKLWDVKTGRVRVSLKGHTMRVASLAFALQDKVLVSGSFDRTLKLGDWTPPQDAAILTRPAGVVTALAPAPNGHTPPLALMGGAGGKGVPAWELDQPP